jgi:hypothetical protein
MNEMNRITTMEAEEIKTHVGADMAAEKCGCGGSCPACAAHREFIEILTDEEREDFSNLVESTIYRQ